MWELKKSCSDHYARDQERCPSVVLGVGAVPGYGAQIFAQVPTKRHLV